MGFGGQGPQKTCFGFRIGEFSGGDESAKICGED